VRQRFSAERNDNDAFNIYLFFDLLKPWEQRVVHEAFRRGCNLQWELAGIKPAVIRQQMGHTSAAGPRSVCRAICSLWLSVCEEICQSDEVKN